MRTDRLTELADYLESIDPSRFDIQCIMQRTLCGTVGCAMGYTPHLWPELVCLEHTAGGYYSVILRNKSRECSPDYTYVAAELFDIDREEAIHLFSAGAYFLSNQRKIVPLDVVNRIRALVASNVPQEVLELVAD